MYNVGEVENGILYNGYVDFKLVHNGKYYSPTRKNAGTKFLRDLICEALHGSINVDLKLPRYVNLVYTLVELDETNKVSLTRVVPLLERPVPINTRSLGELAGSTDIESVLLLKSLISYTDLRIQPDEINFSNDDVGDTGKMITDVKLLLEDVRGNVLSEISDVYDGNDWISEDIISLYKSILGSNSSRTSLDDGTTIEKDSGVDAMIEWRLVFKNGA